MNWGMNWLRHAFATGAEASDPLGPEDQELVERFCRAVVRRGLTVPVLTALETFRPLSGVAAQGLHFFTPLLTLLVTRQQIERLASFLQRSDAVEFLCQRLEALEANTERPENSDESPPSAVHDPSGFAEEDFSENSRTEKAP